MNVVFNFEKLEKLLGSFYEISGVRYSVMDSTCNVVCASSDRSEYCACINATPEGHARCVASDARAAKAATPQSGLNVYHCHAGALDVVQPVVGEGQIVAYLLFGQMLHVDEDPEVQWLRARKTLSWYEDPDSLREPFLRLKRFDQKTIKACAAILRACSSYIWLEGVVKTASLTDIQRINAYIEANYTSRIMLDDMARALSVSKTKLCNAAAKQKTTITRMISDKRIAAAKGILESTDHSVAEVADMVGMGDYNYFIKLFKSFAGVTPRQYRKLMGTRKTARV